MLPRALRTLARSYGLLTSYRDVHGENVEADPEILVVVLRSLGATLTRIDDAEDALRQRRLSLCRRVLEPVTTLWDGVAGGVSVNLPADVTSRSLHASLRLENGDVHDWSPRARTVLRTREVDGTQFLQTRFPLPPLPHGYHRLTVTVAGIDAETSILRAPVRSFHDPSRGRRWGLFAPIYGLRSARSAGIGNFADLGRLMDLTARRGGRFVATLPFLASFPGEASPYSPVSRLFWNELFIDTQEEASGRVNRAALLDYPELYREQRQRLERRTLEAQRQRPDALALFQKRFPLALDYARFRATVDERGTFWKLWPERQRTGLIEDADVEEQNVAYHLYCQLAAEEQIAELTEHEPELYLDLPLGVHPFGYDTWRERTLFAHDVDVGAPPDAAFAGGQNWSFPPVLPEASRRQAHRHLRLVYRHAMRHANTLRIDHVMGLHRQFWIPKGAGVADGVYVRYPADELYAILSLESHRAACELVGENLGIVPHAVNERLEHHGMRSLYVMQLTPDASIPRDAVASLNTHDTDLFAGAHPDETDLAGSLRRSLATLFASRAELVSVTLEDLWLETERQNVPGTIDEHPNWRRPLRYSLDELEPRVGAMLDTFERR